MERNNQYNLEKYLTITEAAEILQVELGTLYRIVANGIIQPLRQPAFENPSLWGSEEVMRSFFALRLIGEFRQKYGRSQMGYEADQVRSDLFRTIRVRGPEIFKSKEWKKVVKRASEHGLIFKESIL